MSIELTEDQTKCIEAVCKAVHRGDKLIHVAGLAGTGKSTIIPNIVEELGYKPWQCAFAGPTGMSAKVIRDKLDARGIEVTTSTIHKLIYKPKPDNVDQLEKQLSALQDQLKKTNTPGLKRQLELVKKELNANYNGTTALEFHLNFASPLKEKLICFIDEASMVGQEIAQDLLSFGVTVVAIGDPRQLQPINDVQGLTNIEPVYTLTEIHRQAKDDPIIYIAHRIVKGLPIKHGKYGDRCFVMPTRDFSFDDDLNPKIAPKIICGMNKTRWSLTKRLRDKYMGSGTSKLGPRKNEPLVVTRNSKQYPDLVNGSQCIGHSDIDLVRGRATFDMHYESENQMYRTKVFQGRFEENFAEKINAFSCDPKIAYRAKKNSVEMDFSYAITAHKAQGSQWESIVAYNESSIFDDPASWLYTVCTRAEKQLHLLM